MRKNTAAAPLLFHCWMVMGLAVFRNLAARVRCRGNRMKNHFKFSGVGKFSFFLLGGVGGNDEMGRQREMVLRKFL